MNGMRKKNGLTTKTLLTGALCAVVGISALSVPSAFFGAVNGAAESEKRLIVSEEYAMVDYCGESNFSVFLDKDGYLYASGDNSTGQLGRKKLGGKTKVEPLDGKILNEKTVAFDTGKSGFVLAITESGKLYGWGNNGNGQLAQEIKPLADLDDKSNCFATPTEILLPDGCAALDVQAGDKFSLLLSVDGDVYAWGQNNCGQLGLSLEASRKVNVITPTRIPREKFGGEKISQIATGEYTAYAVTESGKLYAWGDTYEGQLCDGETDGDSEPITAPKQTLLSGVKKVSAQSTTAMALTENGVAYVWGNNTFGQFGIGRLDVAENKKWSNIPLKIEAVYDMGGAAVSAEIVDILCGGTSNFLLSASGDVYAFGKGGAGELGFVVSDAEKRDNPYVQSPNMTVPTRVTFYEPISIEQRVKNGEPTDITPVDKTVKKAVKITAFVGSIGARTFVKDADGNVWSWGDNLDGMAASGNVSPTDVPVRSTLFRDKNYDVDIKEKNYLIEPIVGLSVIFGGAALFFVTTEIKWARRRKLEKVENVKK